METNKKQPLINQMFEGKVKLLLSVRNFEESFAKHSENLQNYLSELVRNYERASDYLKEYAHPDLLKRSEDLINEIHVYANQCNRQLIALTEALLETNQVNYEAWKDLEIHKSHLYESALHFENLGLNYFKEECLRHWETDFVILKSSFQEQIENELNTARFVLDFIGKYSREERQKVLGILKDTSADDVNWSDPKEQEAHFLKAIRQFQEEFEPKTNLWDSLMELLAGGVHPSPSERIMLEKWNDGEQKEREDM
ncbi:MAG: hypothetical protein GX159_08310 [Flavobacteriaceae bacterium]|jgi:hypothetical protein|nr:hypothetical protein [Flavobacteriaceae bacterium]